MSNFKTLPPPPHSCGSLECMVPYETPTEIAALNILQNIEFKHSYDFISLENTFREKALPVKTPVLRKNSNIGVWTVGTLNELYMRGS